MCDAISLSFISCLTAFCKFFEEKIVCEKADLMQVKKTSGSDNYGDGNLKLILLKASIRSRK